MNRRTFINCIELYATNTISCMAGRRDMEREVQRWEEHSGLTVLNMSLTAFKIGGIEVGRLILPDCCRTDPAVSPDGENVAWIPASQSSVPSKDGSTIQLWNGRDPIWSLPYEGRYARILAIAAHGKRAAVVARKGSLDRLILVDVNRQDDITTSLSAFDPADVERLCFSASGQQLVVGSRTSFVLIDLGSPRVTFKSYGRFPAIAPDGNSLAFVNSDEQLVCFNLKSSSIRVLQQEWRMCGVGAWSPDSRYLLAGKRVPWSFWNRLIVIDPAEDDSVESIKLGEGDYGNRCVWISSRFISKEPR